MKAKLWGGVLLLSSISVTASANDFGISLNDDVISTEMNLNLQNNATASLGYIYSNDGGSLLSGAMHVAHDAGIHHFEIGAKYSYAWAKNSSNGSAIGVGGRYAMALGSNLSFQASGYYAPSVLSFGSVDGMYELDSKIQFQLNPSLALYTGYRNIRLQYDNSQNSTFDSGFYIGGKASF
ncbi:YfaZ family outer membrane protein [Shewanella sp. UCD-KL12]|uniref:YfaZ family outer membrane protein n=1 Tax=Shewanella sp. UCD-KL12 TaxID=1917163 RepID=UPI0009705A7F|nr:YfaZ family outer membrane protein [Shewanella sp. UCD-KL12]